MALKIVVGAREQGTGNRLRRERQPNGFGQLYFSLLMSVFFRSHLVFLPLTLTFISSMISCKSIKN
ncbi:hypothetical protein PN492_12505 [Dolichospermum circinale CS-537/01]|uniref:Transposase n=1 Tax=Dolichospermum circinale CS-537/01 TaxID=3021739 RepID=A0ABT5A6Q2_9CYAN|nr:hypothetical protein [Dolichospermum circinale]MDB9487358.1 hypothetical protein [Dolichospermum circinale CS-537/01]